MENNNFYYFNCYRGHHRKGITIYIATEVNLPKTFGFKQQKGIFDFI